MTIDNPAAILISFVGRVRVTLGKAFLAEAMLYLSALCCIRVAEKLPVDGVKIRIVEQGIQKMPSAPV